MTDDPSNQLNPLPPPGAIRVDSDSTPLEQLGLPMQDFKDLLALHGAGTFARQTKAQIRKGASEAVSNLAVNTGVFVVNVAILLGASFVLVIVLLLISLAFGFNSSGTQQTELKTSSTQNQSDAQPAATAAPSPEATFPVGYTDDWRGEYKEYTTMLDGRHFELWLGKDGRYYFRYPGKDADHDYRWSDDVKAWIEVAKPGTESKARVPRAVPRAKLVRLPDKT
jgi:hypothetical protein